MSLRTKKRVAFGFLVLLALWPAAHHFLTRHYEMDPWLFFGWAMYASPDPRIELRAAEVRGGTPRVIELPEELRTPGLEYIALRGALGKLAPPHELADAIMEVRPGSDGLIVGVRRFLVDPIEGRVKARDEVYEIRRER